MHVLYLVDNLMVVILNFIFILFVVGILTFYKIALF